jgi:hypothetical protein
MPLEFCAECARNAPGHVHVQIRDVVEEADLLVLNERLDPEPVKHQHVKILGLRLK